jgi:hypothetical protein
VHLAPPRPQSAPKSEKTTGTPISSPKAPQEAPNASVEPSATNAAGNPATVSASPEHGDAYEGPDDDGTLPTEEELTAYRKQFSDLGTELKGKLKTSDGLPVNRKLLTFLMKMAGVGNAKQISKAGWDNFFTRVEAAKAKPEVGLVGIAKMVNKANGIEEK